MSKLLFAVLASFTWNPALPAQTDEDCLSCHSDSTLTMEKKGRTVSLTVDPAALASRSRNTPYAGRELRGKVRHTVLLGEPVVLDGEAQR